MSGAEANGIYLIKRTDAVSYGDHVGFVIIAPQAADVRRIAARAASSAGQGPWFDAQRSAVELLGTAAPGLPEGIVLTDYWEG